MGIEVPGKREFSRLLRAGHGRAALLVHSDRGEPFRDQVVRACFRECRCERMTCASLGPYLARMLVRLKVDAIKELEEFICGDAPKYDREFACEVLAGLVNLKFKSSRLALWRCVTHTLRNKESFAASEWIYLFKRQGFEEVFSRVERVKGDVAWIENAWWSTAVAMDYRSMRVLAQKYPRIHKAIDVPREAERTFGSFEEFMQFARAERPSTSPYWRYARSATAAELKKAARALGAEKRTDILVGLLHMFWSKNIVFKGNLDVLIKLAEHRQRRVRWKAFHALSLIRHSKVRQLALECLAQNKDMEFAINLFRRNFKKGDIARLWHIAKKGPKGFDLHSFVMLITEDEIVDLHEAQDPLRWAYYASDCSGCRWSLVWKLVAKGEVPRSWKRELMHDSERNCREIGRKL